MLNPKPTGHGSLLRTLVCACDCAQLLYTNITQQNQLSHFRSSCLFLQIIIIAICSQM